VLQGRAKEKPPLHLVPTERRRNWVGTARREERADSHDSEARGSYGSAQRPVTALQGRGTKRECKAQWIAAAVNASIAPDPSGARDGGPGSQQRTRRTVEMWNLLKRFQWVLSRKQSSSNSSQTANCNSQTSSALEKPVVEKEGTYPQVDLQRQPAGRFHELLGAASPWESPPNGTARPGLSWTSTEAEAQSRPEQLHTKECRRTSIHRPAWLRSQMRQRGNRARGP